MVDFGPLRESVFFKDPVDLLFFAPHEVPIIAIGLFPLAMVECLEDAVAEGGLELDVLAG